MQACNSSANFRWFKFVEHVFCVVPVKAVHDSLVIVVDGLQTVRRLAVFSFCPMLAVITLSLNQISVSTGFPEPPSVSEILACTTHAYFSILSIQCTLSVAVTKSILYKLTQFPIFFNRILRKTDLSDFHNLCKNSKQKNMTIWPVNLSFFVRNHLPASVHRSNQRCSQLH